jgi:hypothetical protein
MRRTKRRRPVHYITFIFPDGAAVTCTPTRKPSKKKIKDEGIHIDADHVIHEYHYSAKEFHGASDLRSFQERLMRIEQVLISSQSLQSKPS